MSNSRALRLTFGADKVDEPVIYHVVKEFDVVPNIRRAAIENHLGWMVVLFEGEPQALDAAEAYLREQGVQVDPATGDIVAG